MREALSLAGRGRLTTHPNPRVGCVVVRDGAIVGRGFHLRAGEPHAEIHALREAAEAAQGADVYVTLEPCSHHGRTPPCADTLIAAGVKRVFAAMQDPNPQVAGQGFARLRAAGIEVVTGICEAEAQALNAGFVSRITRGRPRVLLKVAASLDGRTAMADGQSKWITGEAARADVHRSRAETGAVLTSASTALADDPQLNVRLDVEAGITPPRQPDRIVLDRAARVPAGSRVWAPGARRFRFLGARLAPQVAALPEVESVSVAETAGGLDLQAVLAELARREMNEVLVECGPWLAGALLGAHLVDEIRVYLAPRLLGDAARGLAHLPGLRHLDEALRWRFTDIAQIGPDLRLSAIPEAA